MMRASGRTPDGRPLLILGLERGNIEPLSDSALVRIGAQIARFNANNETLMALNDRFGHAI